MSRQKRKPEDALALLRRRGPLSASALMSELGLSQPSLSRLLQKTPGLLLIGQGPSRRYALQRGDESYPLVLITDEGDALPLGELKLLEPKGSLFLPQARSKLRARVFEDVPYFIWDLRPQGYLGRLFVTQNTDLKFPERWEDWNESDLFRALKLRGDDLAGNLVIGREALQLFQSKALSPIPPQERPNLYPKKAAETLQGTFVGSSAGGEQPKFTASIAQRGEELRHVIVKFSPPTNTPAGRRWADLLRAEHWALRLLETRGLPAARSEIIDSEDRVFLEVTRFDRIGQRGRRGFLSLGALDDEYVGARQNWSSSALRLHALKLIATQDLERILFLDAFGALIANTDRHFGNLGLYWELGSTKFSLAPVYDMLPMLYSPLQGNVVSRTFTAPVPTFEQMDVWPDARSAALEYWKTLAEDKQISIEFRQTARTHLLQGP
jgi:hypothetical protein